MYVHDRGGPHSAPAPRPSLICCAYIYVISSYKEWKKKEEQEEEEEEEEGKIKPICVIFTSVFETL
jgi:hypothetical protein